ncbi:MAG: hypothetical protein ABIH03_03070 [Pseudomonadota bacterium]
MSRVRGKLRAGEQERALCRGDDAEDRVGCLIAQADRRRAKLARTRPGDHIAVDALIKQV